MAGKRQHFLPQFLMKGFASRESRGKLFCWVFRKGGKPFETNLTNIGVEGKFYEIPENTTLDATVTGVEAEFSALLDKLRIAPTCKKLDEPKIPQLIVHLSLRTRHLRHSFTHAGTELLDHVGRLLEKPADVEGFILQTLKQDPELFRDAIREEINKRGLQYQLDSQSQKMLIDVCIKVMPEFVGNVSSGMHNTIAKILELTKDGMINSAKTGQIRGLSKSLSPETRIEKLSDISWYVVEYPPHSLIIGDVGVWAITIEYPSGVPLAWAERAIQAVFLPISHHRLIVGAVGDGPYSPILDWLNRSTAKLSLEFFISSTCEVDHHSGLIGSEALSAMNEKICSALIDTRQKWLSVES